MTEQPYTSDEMMTIAAARALADGMTCFVGIGLPSAAANLARVTHAPSLVLIYPQGNPLQVAEDSPYLQVGECKYGRPILDRGIQFDRTTLEEAAKYALLSLDSTMKSNVTVGPPIDLLVYPTDELDVTRHRRFLADDPDLAKIRVRWEQALRQAVLRLPNLRFHSRAGAGPQPARETIELVEQPAESESHAPVHK